MIKTGIFILLGSFPAFLCAAQNNFDRPVPERFIMVSPESRLRVGFDFDGDNRVDTYEYISGSDLMRIRRPETDRSETPLVTMTGEIDDLKQVRLTGLPERHVVGRIRTENGQTFAVDLGPKSQVSMLNLENGDWVSIKGAQGSINRNKMLMAMQIRTEDQSRSIDRPQGPQELRFVGEIKETSVRDLGPGRSGHLLALVELEEDKEKVVVDLGSEAELKRQDLDLSRNDDIVFLARPAVFEGKNLLVATRVGVDGEMYRTGQMQMPL